MGMSHPARRSQERRGGHTGVCGAVALVPGGDVAEPEAAERVHRLPWRFDSGHGAVVCLSTAGSHWLSVSFSTTLDKVCTWSLLNGVYRVETVVVVRL